MPEYESLEAELIRAGRAVVVEPPPDDLAERVLSAIQPAPPHRARRAPGWWRWFRARRWRLVAAVIAAVIVALTLTPPVRAAVIEWLRIGGVVVRTGAPPAVLPTPEPPPTPGVPLTLEQARAQVAFPIGVPARLGTPERVSVSPDRRVVGMDWIVDGRAVHLDQFDGTMSWAFVKQHWTAVTPTEVDGGDAVWLADPHEITYVDRDGVERPESARISGPCLVWEPTLDQRRTTARLEGIAQLPAARAVAETLR